MLRLHSNNQQHLFVSTKLASLKIQLNQSILGLDKEIIVLTSSNMGKAFVPDRYIDIFQGRAPRNVLAKHYTGKGLGQLKRIYEKANLKVVERG